MLSTLCRFDSLLDRDELAEYVADSASPVCTRVIELKRLNGLLRLISGDGVPDLEPSNCREARRCFRRSSTSLPPSVRLTFRSIGWSAFLCHGLYVGPLAMTSASERSGGGGVIGRTLRRCFAMVLALPKVGRGPIEESRSLA